MSEESQQKAVGSVRAWEVIVALVFLVFGAIVVWDSRRLGASWSSDGPQAGYFPFYIGLFIVISSAFILLAAFKTGAKGAEAFVRRGQLKMVLTVIIPTAVYVLLIDNPWLGLGIYVASAIYIAAFMRYLGHYSWAKIAGISLGTMLVFFFMFEIWFRVPLPKGPVEAVFGYQ